MGGLASPHPFLGANCWLVLLVMMHLVLFFSSILQVQQTVEIPQLQFFCVVVDLPVFALMPSLWSRLLVGPLRFPSCSSTRWSMSLFCGMCRSLGFVVVKTAAPSVAARCECGDVVWWWKFFSRWCLRFCMGQRYADEGKYTINYFQYQDAVGCFAMSCGGESFSPYGAYVYAWDRVKPMKGKYTINYIQYQDGVECVCMLNDGSAAMTNFAPITTTTFSSS